MDAGLPAGATDSRNHYLSQPPPGGGNVATFWQRTPPTKTFQAHSTHPGGPGTQASPPAPTPFQASRFPSHGGNAGSNPAGVTGTKTPAQAGVFSFSARGRFEALRGLWQQIGNIRLHRRAIERRGNTVEVVIE